MCATCGCGEAGRARIGTITGEPHDPAGHDHAGHTHDHAGHDHAGHDHAGHTHDHAAEADQERTVLLEQQILAKNDSLAERNRAWLADRAIVAVNLMSSPGSGKTTLLERTIRDLGAELKVSVIEGDQETPLDAERIRATGSPVVQINTGAGCHLDASMVERALGVIDPPSGSIVFIENVGNLVCPALFDLGERARIVIMSVTEGADKPLKYPHMFRAADLVLLNKSDLLPHVDFDVTFFESAVRQINPDVSIFVLSATTGEGIESWYQELRALQG